MKKKNICMSTTASDHLRLFFVALLLLGMSSLVRAQNFEVLLDNAGEVREEAYDYLRKATFGSDQAYEKIQASHLKDLMNQVVGFSRQSRDDGNRYWGRISGTPYEAMTGEWVGERFTELGLEDIHTVEFDLSPQWFPIDWTLTAIGDGATLNFPSANPATRTPGFSWD